MKLRERNFESEFTFRTSRSGGKGGQNVNKTETRVELVFNIPQSALLTEAEKKRLGEKLATQLSSEGELRLYSAETRSQAGNKEIVIDKFYSLLEKALKKEKKRVPTKIPKAVKQNIREKKRKQAEKKGGRRLKTRDFL